MNLRSILMGFLVVLMGMAAGLLLSLLFWPSAPQPPLTPQGLVRAKLPPEPLPSLEPAAEKEAQLPQIDSPGSEAKSEAGQSPVSLPAQVEKKPQEEQAGQRQPDLESVGQPEPSSEAAPQQKKAASARPRGESKRASSSSEKVSFSFTLHVESFKSAEAAERRVHVLRGQGLDAFSQPAQIPGKGLFHRVFVGKFQDRASAKKFLEKLKAENKVQGGRVVSSSEMGG